MGPAGYASYAPRPSKRAEDFLIRGWWRGTKSTGALEVMRSGSHDRGRDLSQQAEVSTPG
jgi:hypothetical protein